jgi:single-stranded DNA-binding protein
VRRRNPKDEENPFTDWFTLNAWQHASRQLERIQKGEMITVRGQIELKEYEDREGNARIDCSIYTQEVFGPKKWVEDKGESPAERTSKGGSSGKKDDLPF